MAFTQRSSGQKMGFSPVAAKLLIGSKKLADAKMARTSSITMPSMVEIVGRACTCYRRKSVMLFCLFLSRFGMTKFLITETL